MYHFGRRRRAERATKSSAATSCTRKTPFLQPETGPEARRLATRARPAGPNGGEKSATERRPSATGAPPREPCGGSGDGRTRRFGGAARRARPGGPTRRRRPASSRPNLSRQTSQARRAPLGAAAGPSTDRTTVDAFRSRERLFVSRPPARPGASTSRRTGRPGTRRGARVGVQSPPAADRPLGTVRHTPVGRPRTAGEAPRRTLRRRGLASSRESPAPPVPADAAGTSGTGLAEAPARHPSGRPPVGALGGARASTRSGVARNLSASPGQAASSTSPEVALEALPRALPGPTL